MEKTITNVLNDIQCKLVATKDQYNSFGKYPYRNAESILANVKPYLKEHGVTLTMSDEVVFLGNRFYIKATVTLTNGKDSVSVSAYAREEESKKGMDGSQVTGASSSYARKYALCGLFAIDGEKDADALNTSPEYTERPTQVSQRTINALAEAKRLLDACKSSADVAELWLGNPQLKNDKEWTSLVSAKGSELKSKGL